MQCEGEEIRQIVLAVSKVVLKERQEAWDCFNVRIKSLSEKYIQQIGDNACALLNVISDLASGPSNADLRWRERHSLRRVAGAWLAEFSSECKHDSFSLPRHLRRLQCAGTGLQEFEKSGLAFSPRRP